MSAFVDCASKTTVLRVPHTIVADMVEGIKDDATKRALVEKLKVASSRSNELRKMLEDRGIL